MDRLRSKANMRCHDHPQPRGLVGFLGAILVLARTRPLAMLAMATLLVLFIVALLADVIATHDPLAQDVARRLRTPGADHFFGTDGFGRDVFSRVVHGSRASLLVGSVSVSLGSVVGVSIGIVSAYWGGKADVLAQRGVDILLGFPPLVMALIMVVALGPSTGSVSIAIAVALAPQVARVSRASALLIKGETYIEAARATGASSYRIVWRHLLPNSFSPILAQVTGYFGTAIVAETALSFLGLGVPPPFPSWGRMLQEGARQYFEAAPWATIFPGLALSVTVLSAALVGDSIRDILDPRHPGAHRASRS